MKKILVAASVAMLWASGAWALGTTAGTSIDNSATLSFSAGGVPQSTVLAMPTTFVVDKKIDMVLEINDANHVPGALGQQNVVTTFSFKNEGNSDERFNFHVKNLLNNEDSDNTDTTANDTKNVSNMVISCSYTDQNGDPQTTTGAAGADIVIFTNEDSTATCTVSATLPTGVSDGEVMNIELNATAYSNATTAEVETTGVDTQAGPPDVVFADGMTVKNGSDTNGLGDSVANDNASTADTVRDGSDVARNGYIISTPVLSAVKTSCVVSDPVNGDGTAAGTKPPKRIPGAVIRYMFDITNSGTADVNDLDLTDPLDAKLITTGTVASAKKTENQSAACTCATGLSIDASADTTLAGATSHDMTIANIDVAKGHAIGTVAANNHTCVSVEVEID